MWVAAAMFLGMIALVLTGIPVAFSLMIVSFVAGLLAFGPQIFEQLYGSFYSASTNFILSAIPMFIFMGALLEKSGVAERLFSVLQLWLRRVPNGLAIGTIAMGAIFAAAAGVVGAVEVMIGLMAIPAMQAAGYRNSLTAGTICAGGSLGTMIPPSVIAVMYASLAGISVGELLAGMLLPGLVMVALFIGWLLLAPNGAARHGAAGLSPVTLGEKLRLTLFSVLPVLGLIVAVLGTILAGIASPTEAAAIGAFGSFMLCIAYRRMSGPLMIEALSVTVAISSMILLIVAAGTMFMGIFAASGGSQLIRSVIEIGGFGPAGVIALFLLVVFVLGFLLDWTANVLICVPLFTPIIRQLGIDPVWFAVLVIIVLQTGYLTPPMASSIFYLKSIAPPDMTYAQMCRGVVPFVLLQILTLGLVVAFPWLVTWMAGQVSGF